MRGVGGGRKHPNNTPQLFETARLRNAIVGMRYGMGVRGTADSTR